jgi:dTMP kinase
MRGALIALEGLDQSGKETQAKLLRARLEAGGRRCEFLSFPDYDTLLGREIGRALHGQREYTPEVTQLLFVANRYEHRARIEQWLAEGAIVLCDRYLASTIAYGEAQGLDPDRLVEIQRFLPQPALTIFLDIVPETAMRRKAAGRDRFERDLALLSRVRASYARQAAQPGWHRIDGERLREDVASDVATVVRARLAQP